MCAVIGIQGVGTPSGTGGVCESYSSLWQRRPTAVWSGLLICRNKPKSRKGLGSLRQELQQEEPLVVEDDIEEGAVHMDFANIVVQEA